MELLAAKHEINGNYCSLFFVQDLAVRERARWHGNCVERTQPHREPPVLFKREPEPLGIPRLIARRCWSLISHILVFARETKLPPLCRGGQRSERVFLAHIVDWARERAYGLPCATSCRLLHNACRCFQCTASLYYTVRLSLYANTDSLLSCVFREPPRRLPPSVQCCGRGMPGQYDGG